MANATGLRQLFQHMHWADARVWRSALDLPHTEKESRLLELFYHIHVVQHAYLQIWRQLPMQVPEQADFDDMPALARWGAGYYAELAHYLNRFDEAGLDGPVSLPWEDEIEAHIGQPPKQATLAQTMLQVISHTTYHRGQVNRLLRELGGEPPPIDFIAWVWLGMPHAEWPSV